MIEFVEDYINGHRIEFDNSEEKARLLNVLKRGVNTLSPSDPEIVRLIGEMEK